MEFFKPTNTLKELQLLKHITEKPGTTQKEIAEILNGAPSMVNLYIKELEEDGYLKRDYKTLKIVDYNITAKGIKRKNFLSINFINELLKLYRKAEEVVEGFLVRLEEKGYRDILVYGAGEVGETILGVIRGREEKPLKVAQL